MLKVVPRNGVLAVSPEMLKESLGFNAIKQTWLERTWNIGVIDAFPIEHGRFPVMLD